MKKQRIWYFKDNKGIYKEIYNVIYEDEKYILVQCDETKEFSFGLKRDFGTLCGFPINQICLTKDECVYLLNSFIDIDKKYDDVNKTMSIYQNMISSLNSLE